MVVLMFRPPAPAIETAPIRVLVGSQELTGRAPGIMVAREENVRPLSGRFVTSRLSTTPPTSVLVVSTSGVTDKIVIVSAPPAGSSVILTSVVRPTLTVTLWITYLAKPVRSALTE